MHAVAVQRLMMQVALEEEMHVAFPGEADAPVQLNGTPRDEGRGVAGGALGHAGGYFGALRIDVDGARRVVEMRPCQIDLHHRVDERMFDRLEETQRAVE